jgi:hypothetical protein
MKKKQQRANWNNTTLRFIAVCLLYTLPATAQNNAAPRYATLMINSPRVAAAHIDGAAAYLVIPTRALRLNRIKPGRHRIRFISGNRQWKKDIQIEAGQTITVNAELPRESYTPQSQSSAQNMPSVKLNAASSTHNSSAQIQTNNSIEDDIERKIQQEMEAEMTSGNKSGNAYIKPQPRPSQIRHSRRKKHKVRRPKVH